MLNHTCPKDDQSTEMRLLDFSKAETMLEAINFIKDRFSAEKMTGVGFSMGGNHLLRYLGSYKQVSSECGLQCAVTIGNPFDILATGLQNKYTLYGIYD